MLAKLEVCIFSPFGAISI